MIIYRCDKCGEMIYRAMMVTMTVEHQDGGDIFQDEYHFCPECMEEFEEWLEDDLR